MIICKNDYLIDQIINDPKYKICRNGKIFKKESGKWKLLNLKPEDDGYTRIKYQYKNLPYHRVVYRKFNGKLDPLKSVNHKDGDRQNNSAKNLELITHAKNQEHKYRVLKNKAQIGFYKINYEIAEQIRADKKDGKTLKELIAKYKLAKSTLSYIVNNKTWTDKDNTPCAKKHYPADPRYSKATPKWSEYNELKEFYSKTPEGMVVDHIIPLNHPDVCGLHCKANLQYLSTDKNSKKSNKFDGTTSNKSWTKKC
jgi:hypothetical protein